MLSNKTFEERINSLNREQREAVEAIEGPILVVAGPGTGKTEILSLRIGNILKETQIEPENILALTFTEAAATNMRKRLSSFIGSSAYRVNIETFHGFCNGVIQNYPEYFEEIIGSGNITEVEAMGILEELIKNTTLTILRPWGEPLHYLKDIYKKIAELKREGLSPKDFLELIKKEEKIFKNRDDLVHEKGAHKGKMKSEYKDFEKILQKNKELQIVYDEYQKTLHKKRLYDYSDMIMDVLEALEKNKDLKLILQENYQYILVDEHQDTNNAQNKILELLCDFHKNPNIFIVGDEKQAIFRFQGASVENFLYFKKLYPEAKLIELSKNYRSGQNILDVAHSLISSRSVLESGRGDKSGNIQIAEFSNKKYEIQYIAERIKKLTSDGIEPSEIAVLYRSNREAFDISFALEKVGVKYVLESDEDLLGEKYVRKFISIFDAIYDYGNSEKLIPVLHLEEFGIDPLDVYKAVSASGKEKKDLYDFISDLKEGKIFEFATKLKEWVKVSKTEHLTVFLEKILRESGILNNMISSKNAESFLGIEKLFEEAKRISANRPGACFADFIEYINVIRDHKLFIKKPKNLTSKDAVRLMTAHKSKGLEFEYVHIVNSTENSFGPKSNRDHLKLLESVYLKMDKDDNSHSTASEDDERRLFYVCLTRAKKDIFVSFSSFDENGKEVLPSPFILELREDRKEFFDTKEFEDRIKENPEVLYSETKTNGFRELDKNFVSELFYSHPLSVTALNNYLDCPWKYFYRNLLRIPSSPVRHQIYGQAMHGAVEDFWKASKDRDLDEKFLIDAYKRHLGLLGVLTDSELKEALVRGSEALSGWFKASNPKITNPVLSEFKIPGVVVGDNILLSGVLDKVEILSDKVVVVTDYKTGKTKSRNEIEGNTKTSKGDIKRQLQFYKLILNLHAEIEMKKGVIEFLEPNDSGKYVKEEFEVQNDEVKELEKTILRVAKEITNLEFWNKTCDEKDCEYCAYRKLL